MGAYITVKNWERFQDKNLARKYVDEGRALPWLRQMTNRLRDYEYSQLHPLSRYVWGELIGIAAHNGPNKIPYDLNWLNVEMHFSYVEDQLQGCLDELSVAGFITFEGETAANKVSAKASGKVSALRRIEESRTEEGLTSLSSNGSTANVKDIFEFWKTTRNHPKARLGEDRKRKIRARLKDGFTVDELKAAVTNVALDPWEDRGRHDDIVILFRSESQVEKFLELGSNVTVLTRDQREQRHLASLRDKEVA